jgi:hypothetical protein
MRLLNLLSTSSHTAEVTSFVEAVPPKSLVVIPFSHIVSTTSRRIVLASTSPSHCIISAIVQNVATGFADDALVCQWHAYSQRRGEKHKTNLPMPIPVISNADPWMGSNIDGFCRVGSKLLVGAIPIDPAREAARSERISACCEACQQPKIFSPDSLTHKIGSHYGIKGLWL